MDNKKMDTFREFTARLVYNDGISITDGISEEEQLQRARAAANRAAFFLNLTGLYHISVDSVILGEIWEGTE